MALWLVSIDKVQVWIQTKILANVLLTSFVTRFHPWCSAVADWPCHIWLQDFDELTPNRRLFKLVNISPALPKIICTCSLEVHCWEGVRLKGALIKSSSEHLHSI